MPAIENAFRFKIFAKDVYLIPDLPSDLQAGDVVAVTLMALAAVLPRHALPELARGARQPGRGAAL